MEILSAMVDDAKRNAGIDPTSPLHSLVGEFDLVPHPALHMVLTPFVSPISANTATV